MLEMAKPACKNRRTARAQPPPSEFAPPVMPDDLPPWSSGIAGLGAVWDVAATTTVDSMPHPEVLTCSARGCQEAAAWSLLWNNPKIHTPDRRKSWMACAEHRESLGDFLRARQFLRDVEPVPGDKRSAADG